MAAAAAVSRTSEQAAGVEGIHAYKIHAEAAQKNRSSSAPLLLLMEVVDVGVEVEDSVHWTTTTMTVVVMVMMIIQWILVTRLEWTEPMDGPGQGQNDEERRGIGGEANEKIIHDPHHRIVVGLTDYDPKQINKYL